MSGAMLWLLLLLLLCRVASCCCTARGQRVCCQFLGASVDPRGCSCCCFITLRHKTNAHSCRQLLSTCSGTLWQPPCHREYSKNHSPFFPTKQRSINNAPRWPRRVFFWLWLNQHGHVTASHKRHSNCPGPGLCSSSVPGPRQRT